MATVVYSMGMSLDGFVEDAQGHFGFAAPREDVHRLANEEAREAQAFLYGRRMFQMMEGHWPGVAERPDGHDDVEVEFARAYVETPRIVFSDTLTAVGEGARLVRSADTAAEVARLKALPGGPLAVGGATLAASLIEHIDEFRMWVSPAVVGAGRSFFPAAPMDLRLELIEARTMDGGVLSLSYRRA